MELRKQREEEQRQREEEMARLHQAALAESAAHAMSLEADINAASSSELQSLSKELDGRTEEQEAKPDDSNEMVWHPYVKIWRCLTQLPNTDNFLFLTRCSVFSESSCRSRASTSSGSLGETTENKSRVPFPLHPVPVHFW